jgi:hypothetical protein
VAFGTPFVCKKLSYFVKQVSKIICSFKGSNPDGI